MHLYKHHISTRGAQQMSKVTDMVREDIEKSGVKDGIVVVFSPHTTAGFKINEKADPGVVHDMLKGFELGADDYICKPFRPRELLARINTVLRRKNGKSEFLSCKDITVDVQKAVVRKGNTELFLSALEYRLLLVFLQNPGVVFSRKKLLEMIWDVTGDFISDNTLTPTGCDNSV